MDTHQRNDVLNNPEPSVTAFLSASDSSGLRDHTIAAQESHRDGSG